MNANTIAKLKKCGVDGEVLSRFVEIAKTRALWSIDTVLASGNADVEISAIGKGGSQRISAKRRLGKVTIRAFDNFQMVHKEILSA